MLNTVINIKQLQEYTNNNNIKLINVVDDKQTVYNSQAINLTYSCLAENKGLVQGLLPKADKLRRVFSTLNIKPSDHIVAYDTQGGLYATRLLWTLDLFGHKEKSLLSLNNNDSIEKLTQVSEGSITSGNYPITSIDSSKIVDKDFILNNLDDSNYLYVDTRSEEEYLGKKLLAKRCGHIPNAINLNWQNLKTNTGLMKSRFELESLLEKLSISKGKHIVCYCQTNKRATYLYWILKYLGFPTIATYNGAWSEWGNSPEVPIE